MSTEAALQNKLASGQFGPEDLMPFFEFLARRGNEDEEMQDEVEGWSGVIQFRLEGLGDAWLAVNDGVFEFGRGQGDAPAVTLIMPAADAARIFTGQLDPAEALGAGALRIEGDMTAALRLQALVEIAMDALAG